MNLQEAILTNRFISLPLKGWEGKAFCYFLPKTGPCKDFVDCDYFLFIEDEMVSFSTSGPDLYADEILSKDFIIYNLSENEFFAINNFK